MFLFSYFDFTFLLMNERVLWLQVTTAPGLNLLSCARPVGICLDCRPGHEAKVSRNQGGDGVQPDIVAEDRN
jgi:hypothetical protein